MKRIAAIALACLGSLSLIGCGVVGGGTDIVKYSKGDFARVQPAPADGYYAVFAVGEFNPVVGGRVKKGEDLGFSEDGDRLFAVFGESRQPMRMGNYIIKKQEMK